MRIHVLVALLRRNLLYRRRNLIGSVFEIASPVVMILAVLLLKSVTPANNNNSSTKKTTFYNTTIPNASDAFIPLTFGDYVTAFQAQRKCYRIPSGRYQGLLGITGMPNGQYDWQVPFVRCNDMQCQTVGQNAQPFCEYLILGVAPENANDLAGRQRAVRFQQWILQQYPVLNDENKYVLPFRHNFVQLFQSRQDMDAYIAEKDYGTLFKPKLALGVLWSGGNSTQNYKYFLRQNATLFNVPAEQDHPAARTTPDTTRKFDAYAKDDEWCEMAYGAPFLGDRQYSCTGQYLYNGVLTMQNLIGKFILQDSGAWETFPVAEAGIAFVPFPAAAYTEGGFFSNLAELVGIMICLGLLMPVASMISAICKEKELRQKELMKMMGVTEAEVGWSWFLSFLFFYVVILATLVAVVSSQLYENSSPMTMWGFWILTFTALITYCMALSTLTSNGTRGVVIGIMMTLMGAFLVMAYSYWKGEAGIIQVISIHPVAAFSYGLQEAGRLEDAGVGITYNTIESTDGPSGYTFWMCIRMLMFDTAMWGMLTWYLNRVIKPVYGTAQPFYFPFMPSYWLGSKHQETVVDDGPEKDSVVIETGNIPVEEVSESLRQQALIGESIEVQGLVKKFGNKIAVDQLSLNMYKGQVTALLGHNGAGKTTTISMLTGAILPTSGRALIRGKDTRSQMDDIRQTIGICLQHDCLFPQLTVREHLEFFSRIKGVYSKMPSSEAEQHIDDAISDVALQEKTNAFTRNLSGGMKRKLSVAIAFCGGSEAVFLDEPTSGMDPFSRRFTWNVIRRYRQNRCIILTTHFMDEADILGDRIAILSEGRLCCLGSPLFLKKTYGVGYQLTIELPNTDTEKRTSNHRKMRKLVTGSVKEAILLSDVGSEMTYRLPVGASSRFVPMFDKLDRAVDNQRAVSYGVGITTLEEVFLLVSRGGDKMESCKDSDVTRKSPRPCTGITLEDDSRRAFRHTRALFNKRVWNFRRDKKAWLCTTLFPSAFVFAGFLSVKLIANERDFRQVALRIDDYNVDAASPRNPIGVNNPSSPFTCQPGYCSYNESESLNWIPETDESYYFCGEQARFSWEAEHRCSISTPTMDVIKHITEGGAEVIVQNVSSVLEASAQLWNSANAYVASQYGAIYFTRDRSSLILETGDKFDDKALETCMANYDDTDYMTPEDCEFFSGIGYIIHYNFTALHVSPTFQVLATQSLAREAMKTDDFYIDCVIDPLPITNQEKGFSDEDKAFNAWYLVVLGFPFVASTFATFVVEEKASKSKHLQTVAGVSPTAYWLSTFLWDSLNYYLFPMCITIVLMLAFDIKMLTTSKKDVFSGVIVLLVLFGPAAASFTYCVSQLFRSPSRCNVFIIVQGFLFGVGGPLAVLYLHIYSREVWKPQPKLLLIANVLSWLMRFNPFFNLGKGLLYAIYIGTIDLIEKGVSTVWSQDILGYEVLFLAWQGIGYLFLAVIIDVWSTNPQKVQLFQRCVDILTFGWIVRTNESAGANSVALPEDSDVIAEHERVMAGEANNDLIVLKELSKVYPNGKEAVKKLSLGIAPGECFGLLGINGAGKTTTLQMLTAEFPPTSGDGFFSGCSVKNCPEKTRSMLGYCPQFDAHLPNLTGREHVTLFACIKAIPQANMKDAVAKTLDDVGLSPEDSDRCTSEYSGGMKRRLSLACAMIGQPRIVFLDEVSTGVDAVARREIWRMVSNLVKNDNIPLEERTSVILTTHSMEECEALCPRLGILVNGRLQCLGSAQRLKTKFGQGFQIEMKARLVKDTDDDYLKNLERIRQLNQSHSENISLKDATGILHQLTGSDELTSLIDGTDPAGYAIYSDATSPSGVQVLDLAAFATFEKRICNIKEYAQTFYSSCILRERQDAKIRFEVGSKEIRISQIFASIEANKDSLMLADYSVSQTSLEQVFNQHAAAAEELKQVRNGNPRCSAGKKGAQTDAVDETEALNEEDFSAPISSRDVNSVSVSVREKTAQQGVVPLRKVHAFTSGNVTGRANHLSDKIGNGDKGRGYTSTSDRIRHKSRKLQVLDRLEEQVVAAKSGNVSATNGNHSVSPQQSDKSHNGHFLAWLEDHVGTSKSRDVSIEATSATTSSQQRHKPDKEQFLDWLEGQVAAAQTRQDSTEMDYREQVTTAATGSSKSTARSNSSSLLKGSWNPLDCEYFDYYFE